MTTEGTFDATREALDVYDLHAGALSSITTNAQMKAWTRREATLSLAISKAFWVDTGDTNSRSACNAVRPRYWTKDDFIHRITQKPEGSD